MNQIRVMVFPGAQNLPLWMMDHIELRYTKSRDDQIAAIQDGAVDIIHTSPDNLSLPDAQGISAFLAGTVGPLELVMTNREEPQILAVDNPRSGFGRLAYKWLREHLPDMPYQVFEAGGTPQRFQALRTGQATLAVMHPPFTEFCKDAGYTILGRIDIGYPTLCGVCRTELLKTERVKTYKVSYRNVIDRLADAQGTQLAREVMAKNLPDIPGDTRDKMADIMREEVIAAGVEFDPDTLTKLRDLT
ncbi:hypothetical protein LLE49_27685 [Alicyclobacillus tolerans]|uniref:hypothetical protein n=1 Tax=Alicyclobacillus tolerans TaxID=90970 RepID=UPI001F24EDB6|nr:hypothetical protein [Alicyclobacillus tolerans]MCF8568505.1 hypothetical protein [Alicyclobacillus tolerans]